MPGTQASVCVLPGFIREFHKRIRTYSVPCPTVLGTRDEYIRGLNLKDHRWGYHGFAEDPGQDLYPVDSSCPLRIRSEKSRGLRAQLPADQFVKISHALFLFCNVGLEVEPKHRISTWIPEIMDVDARVYSVHLMVMGC